MSTDTETFTTVEEMFAMIEAPFADIITRITTAPGAVGARTPAEVVNAFVRISYWEALAQAGVDMSTVPNINEIFDRMEKTANQLHTKVFANKDAKSDALPLSPESVEYIEVYSLLLPAIVARYVRDIVLKAPEEVVFYTKSAWADAIIAADEKHIAEVQQQITNTYRNLLDSERSASAAA